MAKWCIIVRSELRSALFGQIIKLQNIKSVIFLFSSIKCCLIRNKTSMVEKQQKGLLAQDTYELYDPVQSTTSRCINIYEAIQ